MIAYHPYVEPVPNVWPHSCVECGFSPLNPVHRVLPPAPPSTVDIGDSTVDMSPVARVARGMRYLREIYPETLLRIDIDVVDIDDGGRCVLGQMWGMYSLAPECEVYSAAWLMQHGFLSLADDNVEMQASHSALTAEWRNSLYEWMDERP